MKKFLAGLLALMLLAGSALAEGFTQNNAPITIDGVRVAFFAPDGAYLPPMEKEGLLYVPVLSLGENLGLEVTADPETLVVTIGGIRAAFFSKDGAYLPPVAVDGVVYVPLAAFAETAGVNLAVDGDTYALLRKAAASVVQAVPAPAATAAPMYGYVPLSTVNFFDFFTVRTGHSVYEGQNVTVTYRAECDANTSYGLENVKFSLNDFGTIHVPASGHAEASYKETVYTGARKTKDSILKATDAKVRATLKSFSLTGASGKLRMSYQEAENIKAGYYAKANNYMKSGAYNKAVEWYQLLAGDSYLDSAELLKEARAKQKAKDEADRKAREEKKAAENQAKYEQASALLAEGKYEEAIKAFEALKNYADSPEKAAQAREKKNSGAYDAALALETSGDYAGAIAAFKALGDYKDSAQRVTACEEAVVLQGKKADYAAAEALEAQKEYIAAYEAFIALGDFEDSAERAGQLVQKKDRQQIDQLMAEAKYQDAQTLLAAHAQEEWAQQLIRTCNLRGLGTLLGFNADGTSWVEVIEKDEKGQNNGVKKFALIDIHGNLLLPPETYDMLNMVWEDGLSLTRKPLGLYGYLNTKGEMAIPAQYLYAQEFHQGAALVRTQAKQYQVIDTQGKVLAELPDKKGRDYISYVGEGLVTFKEKGKVGLLNLKGKVVLKPKYDRSISQFNHGMAIVTGLQKKLIAYGVINAKGKEVIKLGKFNPDAILSENLISIRSDIKKKDGVINTKGKVVLDYSARRSGDLIIAKKSGGIGAMDLNLKTVVSFSYDGVTVGYQSKVVMLKKKGVYNIYNINDLKNPLIEGGSYTAHISVDSPYITWYDNDLGWFVYDSQGNLIH